MSQVRAQQILKVIGAEPATKAASGRYQRSLPFRAGIRYWTTSLERSRADKFGVQFLGEGVATAHRLERAFVRRGFVKQSTQPSQITFCRKIEWLADGEIDEEAVRVARAEVDAILAGGDGAPAAPAAPAPLPQGHRPSANFRAFMLASPLASADLPEAVRDPRWRESPL